jgi:hypothetical protein
LWAIGFYKKLKQTQILDSAMPSLCKTETELAFMSKRERGGSYLAFAVLPLWKNETLMTFILFVIETSQKACPQQSQ